MRTQRPAAKADPKPVRRPLRPRKQQHNNAKPKEAKMEKPEKEIKVEVVRRGRMKLPLPRLQHANNPLRVRGRRLHARRVACAAAKKTPQKTENRKEHEMKLKANEQEKTALGLIKSACDATAIAKPAKKTITGWIERNETALQSGEATVDGIGRIGIRYSKMLTFDV